VSLAYRIMYRVGFMPWDTGTIPRPLAEFVQSDSAQPTARALDIGCGTGTQSVYLAKHGWDVTGIDEIERPLRLARERARAAGVEVDWRQADAANLEGAGLKPGFALVLDRGCFHGLSPAQRRGFVHGVTALSTPDATLLLMTFARNRVPGGPSGADRGDVERDFSPGWRIASERPDPESPPSGPMGKVPLTWYELVR
jgi:cyclopropane fatty-acyl-phospholipid synthase-like methyltransferase